jgi:uridylate kinase
MARILIKLSGEALAPATGFGIDRSIIARFGSEISHRIKAGDQIAVVVGAGNILRGATATEQGSDRVRGDHMGMLATAINGLAIKDVLLGLDLPCEVLNAAPVSGIVEGFHRDRCVELLNAGKVVVLTGGTGSPFFTTDSAAALRAAEIDADLLLKATKVDGIYDKDPQQHSDAKRFNSISFKDVLNKGLRVMDTAAIALCMENNIPINVFDFTTPNQLQSLLDGETSLGTLVFQE